jgi:hypothetical protein
VSMYYNNNVINIADFLYKLRMLDFYHVYMLFRVSVRYMIITVFGTEREFSKLILVLVLSLQLQSVSHYRKPLTYWVLFQWRKQPRSCKQQFHAYL